MSPTLSISAWSRGSVKLNGLMPHWCCIKEWREWERERLLSQFTHSSCLKCVTKGMDRSVAYKLLWHSYVNGPNNALLCIRAGIWISKLLLTADGACKHLIESFNGRREQFRQQHDRQDEAKDVPIWMRLELCGPKQSRNVLHANLWLHIILMRWILSFRTLM